MIAADTAAARPAEGQVGICKMKQGIVDASTAKRGVFDDLFTILAVVGEIVKGQWLGQFRHPRDRFR